MNNIQKMLQIILNNQNALKKELFERLDKVDYKLDKVFLRLDRMEEKLTRKLDKLSQHLAYIIEKRTIRSKQKVIST